jgi:hypothetical protein
MAAPRPRLDRYGKPLPVLVDASKEDLSATPVNVAERKRMIEHLIAVVDLHTPHLLRRDVTAELTVSFRIVRGTMQDDVTVVVAHRSHRHKEPEQ